MSILKVARMGHPVLRARAKAVDPGDIKSPRFQQLIDDMFETMREYQGVGLAAPQVHVSLRLFVAGFSPEPGLDPDEDEEDRDQERVPLMALINPEITKVGSAADEDWEGCLSIPDIRGKVPRARDPGQGLRPDRTPRRRALPRLHRARPAARDRSPRRGAVLRSDEVVPDAHVPRRVRPLLERAADRAGGMSQGSGFMAQGSRLRAEGWLTADS